MSFRTKQEKTMDNHQISSGNKGSPAYDSGIPLIDEFSYHEPSATPPPEPHTKAAQPVRRSPASIATSLLIDALLLAVGIAFLAFALIVRHFDGTPVVENEHVANALLRAAQIVGDHPRQRLVEHR
jgi:hypothetical protein